MVVLPEEDGPERPMRIVRSSLAVAASLAGPAEEVSVDDGLGVLMVGGWSDS